MELLNIHNIKRKLLNRAVKCYLFQYEKRYFQIIGLSFPFSICCKISLTVISVFLKNYIGLEMMSLSTMQNYLYFRILDIKKYFK